MKRAAWFLVVALGGVAHAGEVKPPLGWTTDPKAAVSLSQQLGALPHFGGLRSIVTTEVYRPAAGGALYVTRIAANVAAEQRDQAATAELVEVDASMRRAGPAARSEADQRAAIADPKQLVGARRWVDTGTGVVTDGRIVIAADAQQLVAVMGECVLAKDAPADVVTACRGALASLDPGLAVDARVPLAIHAATVDAAARPPVAPAPSPSGPALVDSGSRPSLAPIEIPQEPREPDRRPIYVGFGLIVLAAIFYWNRKNREKLERDYEARTADREANAPPAKPTPADGDADDLHAAAADDDTKEGKS